MSIVYYVIAEYYKFSATKLKFSACMEEVTTNIHSLSIKVKCSFGQSVTAYIQSIIIFSCSYWHEWYSVIFSISFCCGASVSVNRYIGAIINSISFDSFYAFGDIQTIQSHTFFYSLGFYGFSTKCQLFHIDFSIKRTCSNGICFIWYENLCSRPNISHQCIQVEYKIVFRCAIFIHILIHWSVNTCIKNSIRCIKISTSVIVPIINFVIRCSQINT